MLKSLSLLLASTALLAFAPSVHAEEAAKAETVNLNPAGKSARGGAAMLSMAQTLYAIGVANGDALTVLTAAKLAATVDVKAGAEVKKETKGDAAAAEEGAAGPATSETMLATARELAGEDDLLISLIEDVEAAGSRGRVGGAVEWSSSLPPGQSDVWELSFFGDSPAEVAILGDGDSNLDLLVTDENGNTICNDVSTSDNVYCEFTPSWNGFFYVTVLNPTPQPGAAKNSYYLMTN